MTMKNKPQAVMMSFQREYAESYDWLVEVFRDWAFTFFSSFLYYQDYDKLDENERSLYRQGMAAFGAQCKNQYNVYKSRAKNNNIDSN